MYIYIQFSLHYAPSNTSIATASTWTCTFFTFAFMNYIMCHPDIKTMGCFTAKNVNQKSWESLISGLTYKHEWLPCITLWAPTHEHLFFVEHTCNSFWNTPICSKEQGVCYTHTQSGAQFNKGLRLIVRWISIVAQWQIVYNLRLIATLCETGPWVTESVALKKVYTV